MSGSHPGRGGRYQEVIIIGATRSGTNMLRDVVCRLPGFGTWPCDEIPYIWRHGNAHWPSDELPPELATEKVKAYINRQFARRARRGRLSHVVEKTCANSLRVPFVDRVLPTALYLFIHRDPVDAVASAIKRWRAPLDLRYTLKKARFVPPADLPYYGWRFVKNRIHRLRSRQKRLAFWGPQFDGMSQLLETSSLAEICSAAWDASVERAARAFERLPAEKMSVVRYEDFVAAPQESLREICGFLAVRVQPGVAERVAAEVSSLSVGKGRRQLDAETVARISELTKPARQALERLLRDRAANRVDGS